MTIEAVKNGRAGITWPTRLTCGEGEWGGGGRTEQY